MAIPRKGDTRLALPVIKCVWYSRCLAFRPQGGNWHFCDLEDVRRLNIFYEIDEVKRRTKTRRRSRGKTLRDKRQKTMSV